ISTLSARRRRELAFARGARAFGSNDRLRPESARRTARPARRPPTRPHRSPERPGAVRAPAVAAGALARKTRRRPRRPIVHGPTDPAPQTRAAPAILLETMTSRRITVVASEPLGRAGTGGAGTADSLLAVALGRRGHDVQLLIASGRDIGRLRPGWP